MTQAYNDQGNTPNLFQPTQQVPPQSTQVQEGETQEQVTQLSEEKRVEASEPVRSLPEEHMHQQFQQAPQLLRDSGQPTPPVSYQPSNSGQFSTYQQPVQQQAQPASYQPVQPAQQATYQQARQAAQQAAQPTQPAQQAAYQQAAQPGVYQQPAYVQAPQVVYAAPPQKKSRSWIVAVVLIVCLFAFTAFCVKSCTDAVSGINASGISSSGPSGDSVAIINIDSTIQYDGTACSPEGFKELLDRASDDPNIKALVLRVNSGGGVATAGEEMSTYLRDFKKPVVVSSASINASAAYEISSQADYIYVAKSTEIGAIGTAMQLTDLSGLLDMLGVNMEVITSSDSKDSSYGYRPLTDEEREYYQHMVDQINDMFLENVAEGRHMTMDEVRALATGMPFTGVDAISNGLADEIGTLEDATDKAAALAGITDYSPYDLYFVDYDLSGLYTLFGNSSNNGQIAFPKLQQ